MAISADKTKLYVDRTVTPNKGITLDEIAACLKDYRKSKFGKDVGLLCTSPNINQWAKFKPVQVDKMVNITDTDRYNANQGFNISWNTQTTNIPIQLINSLNNAGPTWPYVTPTTYKRILDFDGYNHADEKTPFLSNGEPYDGVFRVENDTTSTTHMFFECRWHQRASQIQPADMAIFGDIKATHDFKMGLILKDPLKSYAELHMLYNSIDGAETDNYANAVDMPLSITADTHNVSKYFKVPNTIAGSSFVWNALLVCVRRNKVSGDLAWLHLPTMNPITFKVDNPTGDVSTFWDNISTDIPPMVIVVPYEQNGYKMVQNIYLTHIFIGLYRFFQSTNLNIIIDYELEYNGSQAGSNRITESTQPIRTSGSDDSTMYTYRTPLRGGTGTMVPVDSWDNLILYVSVALDNGDAPDHRIYLKLDEITMQGSMMLIPNGTTTRVGYSIQSIMNALGSSNYQIVQEFNPLKTE